MNGLSLWQPWASLIAWGKKRVETRSWATQYCGDLAIHAAKRWTRDVAELCLAEPFRSLLCRDIAHPAELPRGAVVAVVRLIGCRRTEDVVHQLQADELDLGNYEAGRFAWFLTDVRPLVEPYPLRGAQGVFPISAADATAIGALARPLGAA